MIALPSTGLLVAAQVAAATAPTDGLALPYLFAGASGALAVASALAASAMWRRAGAAQKRIERLERTLRDDLSCELVFLASRGKLVPASPATITFVRAALGDPTKPDLAPPSLGRAALAAFLGEGVAARLNPRISDLIRKGESFVLEGRDEQGRRWSFVGETEGARAALRILPLHAPTPPQIETDAARSARMAAAAAPDGAALQPKLDAADWRTVVDAAPGGAVVFDGRGRLRAANGAARRLLRLEADWVEERPTLRAFLDHLNRRQRMPEQADHRAWRAAVLENPAERLAEQGRWALPNGEALRVAAAATPSGGFVLFVDDETSELALERRFNVAMGARRATIAAVDQGLAVVGSDGAVQLVNPAFIRIWGLERAFGPNCAEAFMAERAAGGVSLADLAAAAIRVSGDQAIWERIEGAALGVETRRALRFKAHRSGPREALEGAVAEEADAGGETAEQALAIQVAPLPDGASLIACADITAAEQIRRGLTDKAEALEAVDRLKTDFLTDMAYQLRTPLNAVIGFADMLDQGLAGKVTDRQKTYVGYVLAAANDLRELISDALDLGALRAGSLSLRQAPFDLAQAVETVSTMAAKRAERCGAKFVASLNLERAPALGDERRLRHALFSATAAALHEAEAGDTVALGLNLIAEDGEAERVEEAAAAEPWARVVIVLERRRKRKAESEAGAEDEAKNGAQESRPALPREPVGVGFSLARRIVEAHGGRVEAAQSARGLAIRFDLPLHLEEIAPDAPEPEEAAADLEAAEADADADAFDADAEEDAEGADAPKAPAAEAVGGAAG